MKMVSARGLQFKPPFTDAAVPSKRQMLKDLMHLMTLKLQVASS
jgi:hypothetical protein